MNQEERNYRIEFYSLSRKALEERIVQLVTEKNYAAQKIALIILEQETSKIISLPVLYAEDIIGMRPNILIEMLTDKTLYDKNTRALVKLELELNHISIEKESHDGEKLGIKPSDAAVGCAGLSVGAIIILIIVIISLLTVLGSILSGIFSIGETFIEGVAH